MGGQQNTHTLKKSRRLWARCPRQNSHSLNKIRTRELKKRSLKNVIVTEGRPHTKTQNPNPSDHKNAPSFQYAFIYSIKKWQFFQYVCHISLQSFFIILRKFKTLGIPSRVWEGGQTELSTLCILNTNVSHKPTSLHLIIIIIFIIYRVYTLQKRKLRVLYSVR